MKVKFIRIGIGRIVALGLIAALVANPIGAAVVTSENLSNSQAPRALLPTEVFQEQALNAPFAYFLHTLLYVGRHAHLNRVAHSIRRSDGSVSFVSVAIAGVFVSLAIWQVAQSWFGDPVTSQTTHHPVLLMSSLGAVPGLMSLLHRLEDWAAARSRLSEPLGPRSPPTQWPLSPGDTSSLYPFQGRIYQNFYEGVDETNPDWFRREMMVREILELPEMKKGSSFESVAIREKVMRAMANRGLGISQYHFDHLMDTLVESGLLGHSQNQTYQLLVEPEVAAVKFRLVHYIERQLRSVLQLNHGEPLRNLLETYGSISERWPLFAVDARKPFEMAVTLLEKNDRERILNSIGQFEGTDEDLRLKYPLLDNLWLMLERAPGQNYIRDHFPSLEGHDLLTLSPEGSRFPLGGLGRVQAYHVEGLDYLAQHAMRIMEGEPYYPGSYDELTQPQEGHEISPKHAVFTNRDYSREFTVQVFGQDVKARVYKENRIFGSENSPGAISIAIEDKNGFYARYRYEYFKSDSANFDQFRYFFSNAFLDYWEQIQLEVYEACAREGKEYKGGWLIANDAQSSAFVGLLRERQNLVRDPGNPEDVKKAEVWAKTHIVQVCHTIYNRINSNTGVDVTGPAIRDADLAWMVSGWHAAYLAPKKDPNTRVVAMFNGSAWKRARETFRHSWQRQVSEGLIQPKDADPDYPTPDQMRIHRADDKKRFDLSDEMLRDLNIERREDGSILDPEMPVFSYSGRPVDEKISRKGANTDNSLRALVNRGKGVNVILYLSPAPGAYGTYESLRNLAREINRTSKGKLIVRWGNTPEEQIVLNNITDNVVQPSRPKTEANGSTEVPGGPNGAQTTTPSGLEGGLQVQGTGDTIIIPRDDSEGGFREAYNQFLTRWYIPELDAEGRLQYDSEGWVLLTDKPCDSKDVAWSLNPGEPKDQWQGVIWESAALSVRISRVNDAKLTSAEMLRQINAEQERIDDPLLALKQYLRGEPGMEKYFNTPMTRKRLADYLHKHSEIASPLVSTDGVARAFVVNHPLAGRPFVLAIDLDQDYWSMDRQDKKDFIISYPENRESFKVLFGERAGDVRFTLWDAGLKVGYTKEHQLAKDSHWRLGVPYPGVQVLVPELAGEDLVKAVLEVPAIVHALHKMSRPQPPTNPIGSRAWLKVLATHLGVNGFPWPNLKAVLSAIGMPKDQRVQVSGLLPTADVGEVINNPAKKHIVREGVETKLYEIPVAGRQDSRIVIKEPMTGREGNGSSIFNIASFQPRGTRLKLVATARSEHGIIGDVTTHLGASVQEVVENPALFRHRFVDISAGNVFADGVLDEEIISRTEDKGFVVYVPAQVFFGDAFDKVRDELSWGYVNQETTVRYLLQHQLGIGPMTDSVALDFDRPATWQWMFDQLKLAQEAGLDGFRFDLAWHYANYRPQMADLKARLTKVRPPSRRPLSFLEEIYQDSQQSVVYHQQALEAAKRYEVTLGPDLYYSNLRKGLESPFWLNNRSFKQWIQENLEALNQGILLNFFSNIDDPTSVAIFEGNLRAIQSVLKVIFLLPGSPALYLPEAFGIRFEGKMIARELTGSAFWNELKRLGEFDKPVLSAIPRILQATNHRILRDMHIIHPVESRSLDGKESIVSFARHYNSEMALGMANFSDEAQTAVLKGTITSPRSPQNSKRLYALYDIFSEKRSALLMTADQIGNFKVTLSPWEVRCYLVQEVIPDSHVREAIPSWPDGGIEIDLGTLPVSAASVKRRMPDRVREAA